jgi:Zn-dependent oligopeptidase
LEDKALEEMMELLEELLEERKKQIDSFLEKKNEELQFDDLIQESLLSYLWKILNHLDQVENNLKLRDIISEFRPKIEDFYNELAYSKEYYNKVLWIQNNLSLDNDQKRILELEVKDYKQRGIDLAEDKQLRVKELNKEMSQV